MDWTIRGAFTALVMGAVVWLLLTGLPLGALAVVLAAVWLRGAAESGRADRFVRYFKSS